MYLYVYATRLGLTNIVPDSIHLRIMYKAILHKNLHLNPPKTFNEKLQWLKLHDRNPIYPILVDKYKVKAWVSERIGEEHVAKTYATWNSVDDIDINKLPEQFVLKTNHDSGGIAICKNKKQFDLESAKRKLNKHLKKNFYWIAREWPYKHVEPLIFAEEYLELNDSDDLPDYKLFYFNNGEIIICVYEDRFSNSEMKKTYFDDGWHILNIAEGGHPRNVNLPIPQHFNEMKSFASALAVGLPTCRIDFYELPERLVFGEITLYPKAGFHQFEPNEIDEEWGEKVNLTSLM